MTDISQQPFVIDASSQFPQSNRAPRTDEAFAMLLGALTNGGGRGLAVDDLAAQYHDLKNAGNKLFPTLRPSIKAAINEAGSGLMNTSLIEALLGDTGKTVFTSNEGRKYSHDTPKGMTFKELHERRPEFWEGSINYNLDHMLQSQNPSYRKERPEIRLQFDALRQLLTNRTGM